MRRMSVVRRRNPDLGDRRNCGLLSRVPSSADDGATLVEMALASTVLFATLFGVIFMAWALYAYDYVSNAAAQAARYASVRGQLCSGFSDCPDVTNAQITTFLQNSVYPGLTASNITVQTTWYSVTHPGGGTASVATCSTTPTTIQTGSSTQCDYPGNQVRVQVQYQFSGTNLFGLNNLTVVGDSQLVISQ